MTTARPPQITLTDVLPRRPIAVRPATTVGPLSALGLFALLFGMLAVVWALLGPDLVRDWRMAGDTAAAGDARLEETRCRSWLYLLTFCSVTAADETGGAQRKATLRYAFLGRAPERPVALLRSRSDASLLSTDLGSDRLLSRTLTLALLAALLLACIAAVANLVRSAVRTRRAFAGLSRQQLTPVAVEIERNNALPPRRRMWVYRYDDAGRQGRTFIELPSRERPLFLTKDERWAVALRGPGGAPPLLLDAGLKCLDLTPSERAAFLEAYRSELEKRGLM